nr:uncharacterized protein LOC125422438 [Ziziphus jujuba var. spinosa]
MDTCGKTYTEFQSEVLAILARHETKFERINVTLQMILTDLQDLRIHLMQQPVEHDLNSFHKGDSSQMILTDLQDLRVHLVQQPVEHDLNSFHKGDSSQVFPSPGYGYTSVPSIIDSKAMTSYFLGTTNVQVIDDHLRNRHQLPKDLQHNITIKGNLVLCASFLIYNTFHMSLLTKQEGQGTQSTQPEVPPMLKISFHATTGSSNFRHKNHSKSKLSY